LLRRRNKISYKPQIGSGRKEIHYLSVKQSGQRTTLTTGLSQDESSNAVFALLAMHEASYEDPLAARDRCPGYS
jgi:hypothetical protein